MTIHYRTFAIIDSPVCWSRYSDPFGSFLLRLRQKCLLVMLRHPVSLPKEVKRSSALAAITGLTCEKRAPFCWLGDLLGMKYYPVIKGLFHSPFF